ncbi:VOC family protein [Rhizobium oryzicola]|uniref:VOC family protein n=1 Tax=Rhizobium oryzicola TaxID=1232668 RepID=A0ABT8ST72_9HYPH|nr:VOC family protein [Rhizobium oryzicola]MDO1581609.1 VOC family protein [Rhizobium oryzicola]
MDNLADHGVRFGRIAAVLPVIDMQRAERFYSRVLGFRKTYQAGDPVRFIIMERDRGELHLSFQPNMTIASGFPVAHLMVDDPDRFFNACKARGVRLLQQVKDEDGRLEAFVIEDSEGNRIDIGRSA